MFRIAIKMLWGDRAKFAGLIFGIAFTSFLVTFAMSYFCGFMTWGFALIAENPSADVWVMDPAVPSTELTTNLPDSALYRVRSVQGVHYAVPMALGTAEVRFPNGSFQSFQVIGVDDASLAGIPPIQAGASPSLLRAPDAVLVAEGGTSDKLNTPARVQDQWPYGASHLDVPTRMLQAGDELQINDRRAVVMGIAQALPRYPARPLLYTTIANASRFLPPERHRLTFVLASAAPGISARELATRIQASTGLRARAASDFKTDTVLWFLVNSEDVGDIAAMLLLAMTVGFGVTGVMLYIFTSENLRHYALLGAMGATPRLLIRMLFVQAGMCAMLGSGLGLGACSLASYAVGYIDYPFRLMWFTPLFGMLMVVLVSLGAAALSVRPVLKLSPAVVFAGR
ncbi:ABC transporter permease [Dyella flagellata]|uniref:ABC transporter permease n=1 Tax=Dyella flagellata TaxID=1867833 RepID=A0ABQ5X8J6_9GAMM|nr:ABC transporter permease [Dyella flagellata]GLQ87383.1 ABC transporter permease [Dyella flagellata]